MPKEPSGVFVDQSKEPVIERVFQLVERYPSRSAAARAWGINVNTLKNYYRRKDISPVPRYNQLAKIAEVENVSMDWLINGSGEPPKKPKSQPQGKDDEKLMEMFAFLSADEKQELVGMLTRKGIETVLNLLDKDNQQLISLTGEARQLALLLNKMPPENVNALWKQAQCSEDLPADIITNKRASA